MKLQILKYEIKKIFCKKSSIISLIVLGIFLGFTVFFCVSGVIYADAGGNNISGIKAVRLLRNEKIKWNGNLTEETIEKVIKENRVINSDSKYAGMKESDIKLLDMKYARKQEFKDIRELISDSYSKIHSYDYNVIDSLNDDDAGKFYSNRVSQLKPLLASEESSRLTKNQQEYLKNSYKTLTTPFKYSYADGWINALEKSPTVIFALAFVTCILIAPIFSVEYQTGSDAILLSTLHGKKKGIIYKLVAGLLSTSLVYWISVCLVFGAIFMIFGFQGGESSLQAHFEGWQSFYHITNSEALWMVLLLGYLACMFICAFAMFISSKVKTSFATIIFLGLILIVPAIIGKQLSSGSLLGEIFNMFPHQMLQGWALIQTFVLYDVYGKVITPYEMFPVLYGIFIVILLPFAYNGFRKHKIA